MTSLEVSQAVRIPADVNREDRVLANLTARQVALLTVTGLVLYAGYAATRLVLPEVVFAIAAIPFAIVVAVLVLGSRDGMSLDRLALAAVRQRLSARVQVAAPEGIAAAPDWLLARTSTQDSDQPTRVRRVVAPSQLRLPAEAITRSAAAGGPEVGVIDLGADGVAVVCACSTVNFALRTPTEQAALVACFGRYLHSLACPVQILIRAQRLDLTDQIDALRQRAYGLPHPALEAAALEHADYLDELASGSDLLQRQVLLILREPVAQAAAGTWLAALRGMKGRRDTGSQSADPRRAAQTRLALRVGETIRLLAPANVVVTPLDAAQATAVLTGACNPDALISPTAVLAGADDIITTHEDVFDGDPVDSAHDPDDPGGHQGAARGAVVATDVADDMWWTR